MESKREQVVKNANTGNANRENGKKIEDGQDPRKREPPVLPLGADDNMPTGGSRRQFRVRQPILQYRWDTVQKLEESRARMREGNIESIEEEMRLLLRKLKDKHSTHSSRAVSTDPPHHDRNDDYCLMP